MIVLHILALVTMGHKLYSASTDGTILVWDISTGPLRDVPVGILQGHRDGIEALCPMPLRSRLMSGGRDSVIKVWDVVAMCELFCFSNSGVTAAVMAVSPDEDLLFTSSWDNTLKVWNMRDVTESPRIVRGHGAPVTALAVSCDRVYSGAGDGVCKVWSISTLLELSSHSGHAEGVTCIAPDRGTFFSTSSDKSIIRHFSSLEELPMGEA